MYTVIGFICGIIFGSFTGLMVGAVLAMEHDQERRDLENYERMKHDTLHQSRTIEKRNKTAG